MSQCPGGVNRKGAKSLKELVGKCWAAFPRTFSSQALPQPATNQPDMIPFSIESYSFPSKCACPVLRIRCFSPLTPVRTSFVLSP